jgi:thiosulfate/3-mercaptopyruvate sulfurtransferase
MSKYEEYAKPDVLVTTDWVADNLEDFQDDDSAHRLVEVDVDTTSYDEGHIPGAVGWNWETQLADDTRRDLASKEDFEQLLEEAGISDDTTVVLYGDNDNWFAAWAYWQLTYYGFDDVKLVDGGRKKWLQEDRELTSDVPSFATGDVSLKAPDNSIRAFSDYVEESLDRDDVELVDVRSHEEFIGEKLGPEGLDEGARVGGHIPGAHNIGWGEAVNDDGTFKTVDELKELYESRGITSDKETIAYCRIGERSSHSWFVLRELLGHENVRNYDGSWTEWGNLVGVPVEKGE